MTALLDVLPEIAPWALVVGAVALAKATEPVPAEVRRARRNTKRIEGLER